MTKGEGQTLTARAAGRLGTVLRGKYRLDRVLGIGGMAAVYKATHRNQAEFAIKMLHPEVSLNESIRARFLREGYAANSIKHPGVVAVVDEDVADDGSAFLVMELLDGVSCDVLWAESGNHLAAELASAIVIELLDVLVAAHQKGVLHRDVKPANLFLTRAGGLKVLDFGIAKVREAMTAGASQGTGTGMTLGTPAFMSPEHARGISRELDGRTDLWAAAATFFSLVSGEFVHAGAETSNDLLIRAATVPARPLAEVAPGVPASIAAVIDRGLAFKRGDRWPDAATMKAALLQAHEESFGRPPLGALVVDALRVHEQASAAKEPTPTKETPSEPTDGDPHRTRTAPLLDETPADASGAALPSILSAVGHSTSSPMLKDRQALPASAGTTRSSRRILVAIPFLLGAIAVGALVIAKSSRETAASSREGGAMDAVPTEVSLTASPAPTETAPTEPLNTPTPSASVGMPTPAEMPVKNSLDASAPAAKLRRATERPLASASASASGSASASASASASPRPQVECSTPFYFDGNGNKVFKKECL